MRKREAKASNRKHNKKSRKESICKCLYPINDVNIYIQIKCNYPSTQYIYIYIQGVFVYQVGIVEQQCLSIFIQVAAGVEKRVYFSKEKFQASI